jgi:hypothetical protein
MGVAGRVGEQHTSGRDITGRERPDSRERPDKGARHDRTLPTAGSSGTSVTRLLSHAAYGGAEPQPAERGWRYLPSWPGPSSPGWPAASSP